MRLKLTELATTEIMTTDMVTDMETMDPRLTQHQTTDLQSQTILMQGRLDDIENLHIPCSRLMTH